MNKGTIVTTINVSVSPRTDYLMATSDDLPGLHITGSSIEQTCERVIAGIKLLYKLNHKLDVEVYEATDNKTFPARPQQMCDRFAVAARQ
jgi:hypothetical protein